MKSALSFSEELCEWFLSIGFRCQFLEADNEFSNAVEISGEGPILMVLVLVRIGDWQTSGSFQKLQNCFEYINSRRNDRDKCILLWEDYWIDQQHIVKSRLMALLGISQKIPARLTKARRIDKEKASHFLEINHLNGSVSSKTKYGLFLPKRYFRVLSTNFNFDTGSEELLVAVATFSYPRIFQNDGQPFKSYELIRFASLLNTNVVGGLDKLLHAFIEEKQPGDVMTYADMDWSDGASYARLGFELRGNKQPEAFYLNLNNMHRSSRSEPQEPNSEYNEILKSPEITVYNMGSMKFVRKIGV